MRRRTFLQSVVAGSALAGLGPAGGARAQAEGAKRPNILFIMDDQHRGDCLGSEGAQWLKTPHLDQLCREGARFTRAYSSLPSCIPARVSLLTGKSPWGHGILGYRKMATSYPNEMPALLSQAGYRTHGVGKMHYNSESHGFESIVLEEAWRIVENPPFHCDYRKWFEANHPDKDVDATGLSYVDHRGARPYPYEEELHPTNWTARQAIDFLDTCDESRPWFLKVSFKRPHPPFDPPKRLMDYYAALDLPKAQVGAWAEKAYGEMRGSVEETPEAPRGNYPPEDIHRSRAAYYACITHVDEQIGEVLAALKRRGELENTLILFTADHGDMMGDHHLWRKGYAYDAATRVPFIVRWPEQLESCLGAARGQVIRNLVELRDVLPTFLDAAGIDGPDDIDGRSVLTLARGQREGWREILDLEHSRCYWRENAWVALTDARFKFIYFTLTGQQQLFELDSDPAELNDLAGHPAYADLVQEWRQRMIAHLSERGAPWVVDGDLAVQEDSVPYGPNHPAVPA